MAGQAILSGVWVSQLALVNFRNYRRLGLEMRPGVSVFRGRNGQGKTNLLESVYVLATTRSPRTSNERELVTWQTDPAGDEAAAGLPRFTRLEARVKRLEGEVHLEMLLKGDAVPPPEGGAVRLGAAGEMTGAISRTVLVNGIATRAAGLIGRLPVVYFSPQDVAVADGPPSGRRQYLNVACSQASPLYLRSLQQYNRILLQRNQVLKQLRERRQPPAALHPWTDQLIRTGSTILQQRLQMLAAVNARVAEIHESLSGLHARLRVEYRSTATEESGCGDQAFDIGNLAASFRAAQQRVAQREVEQAASLVGPHRDDFVFALEGVDLNTYGSRGQQRLAVLALKLAEAEWMAGEVGELPVILLDDILSELDPQKRQYVLQRVGDSDASVASGPRQLWITSTDTEGFPADVLAEAQTLEIDAGTVVKA